MFFVLDCYEVTKKNYEKKIEEIAFGRFIFCLLRKLAVCAYDTKDFCQKSTNEEVIVKKKNKNISLQV